MRPALALRLVVLLVSAAAAGSAVLVVGSRPDLEEARTRADAAWAALRPVLDERYAAAGEAVAACRDRLREDRPLFRDLDQARAAWADAARRGVEAEVAASNRLEGLLARLSVTVASTPRLRSSRAVGGALDAVAGSDAAADAGRRAYNEAVGAYEAVRGGFPRRLVAGALGFDSRRTLELPA